MPNNKKNRKNKEKKAARATTAVVGPTATVQSLLKCPHNPASCDKCNLAYPPGCLHSLREDERMSPEMNEIIPVYNRLCVKKNCNSKFWEHPENAPFANERMVRFFFYHSVKIIVGKDSLCGNDSNRDYKKLSEVHVFLMLHLYGVIKCGSNDALEWAQCAPDMSSLDEGQVSFRALYRTFDFYIGCYHRLVYILNELSPCNCLETEAKRAEEEAEQGQEGLTLGCSNPDCDKKESSSDNNDPFSCCGGCKMAQYCSRHCYKDHWRGDMTSTESSHKIACKAIQELKSILAGGGGGLSAMGDSA